MRNRRAGLDAMNKCVDISVHLFKLITDEFSRGKNRILFASYHFVTSATPPFKIYLISERFARLYDSYVSEEVRRKDKVS